MNLYLTINLLYPFNNHVQLWTTEKVKKRCKCKTNNLISKTRFITEQTSLKQTQQPLLQIQQTPMQIIKQTITDAKSSKQSCTKLSLGGMPRGTCIRKMRRSRNLEKTYPLITGNVFMRGSRIFFQGRKEESEGYLGLPGWGNGDGGGGHSHKFGNCTV